MLENKTTHKHNETCVDSGEWSRLY